MVAFFDSNVLLYVAEHDERKAAIAEQIMSRGGWISVQVLNETAHVARRKFNYDWPDIFLLLDTFQSLLNVIDLTPSLQRRGLIAARDHHLSIYDGMIVAAALEAECDTLYSEDMHAELVVDGRLRIVNPFA